MEPSFENEIDRIWKSLICDVVSKLWGLQVGLKIWARNIRSLKSGVRTKLMEKLESLMAADRNDEIIGEIMETKFWLNWEIKKEEVFWEQRARANWLKLGDRNNAFFHKYAFQRQKMNEIKNLEASDGRFYSALDDLDVIARNFFMDLFTSTSRPGDF